MPLSNHDDWGSPAYYANNTWIYNSFSAADAVPVGNEFLYLAYFVIAMSFGILIHSFYLNRFRFTTIRNCTDASCVCTIIQFFLLFQCASGKPCGQYKTAILVDVLANGAFSAVVQGCDNYITFVRYAAVVGEKRISRTRKILTFIYVFVFLYVCWWPYYWLVPFFANMNTEVSLLGYTYSQYFWNFPFYIMYNLYHSGMLVMEVRRIHSETTLADTSALEIMAWRAIFHDVFSILGIICYCFVYPIGAALQVMLILFGLHFVFNWKAPTKVILMATGLVKTKPSAPKQNNSKNSQKSNSNNPSDPDSDQLGNMSLFTYTYRSLSTLNMNMARHSTKGDNHHYYIHDGAVLSFTCSMTNFLQCPSYTSPPYLSLSHLYHFLTSVSSNSMIDLNRSQRLSARIDRLNESVKSRGSMSDQSGGTKSPSINTLYQFILSTHPLSTHPINTPYQHSLSTRSLTTHYRHSSRNS